MKGKGKNMKKVMLSVNYMNGKECSFACLCIGFKTRRHVYVNVQSSLDSERYLKVKKTDTYPENCHSAINFDSYRSIDVLEKDGLLDCRLEVLEDEAAIEKVKKVVKQYNKELNRFAS